MLIEVYKMDVFREAARNPQGLIRVDFLMGTAGAIGLAHSQHKDNKSEKRFEGPYLGAAITNFGAARTSYPNDLNLSLK